MARHSNSPWKIKQRTKNYVLYSENAPLAVVLSHYLKDKSAAAANASLIATAPQLLMTLKKVFEQLENCMIVTCDGLKVNDNSLRESILDAIVRAEGYKT